MMVLIRVHYLNGGETEALLASRDSAVFLSLPYFFTLCV